MPFDVEGAGNSIGHDLRNSAVFAEKAGACVRVLQARAALKKKGLIKATVTELRVCLSSFPDSFLHLALRQNERLRIAQS